jgi:hypothetical protein
MNTFKPGDVFVNDYPFVRTVYQEWDEDGHSDVKSWKPGVEYEAYGPEGDYTLMVADGTGRQTLTVVDVHKPGRYPTRVFYTVKWMTPEGKEFGKGGLKITTLDAFKRRARGFMHGDWSVRGDGP